MTSLPRCIFASLALLAISGALSYGADSKPADRIVVFKSERKMELYRDGKVIKTYRVALGTNPLGSKTKKGDHRTPEGTYRVDSKNAHSQYHLSLHISYPDAKDRERARKLGVDPGGDVMIHGLPDQYAYLGALHRQYDWTWGCIAVTNDEIEEIWKLVPIGTTIEIKP